MIAIVVVTKTHWQYVCTNLQSTEILESLKHTYEAFALVGALTMTMTFNAQGSIIGDCDVESVWVRRGHWDIGNTDELHQASRLPWQFYTLFLGISFLGSMLLLVFAVIGLLYVAQVPKESGRSFVKQMGPFWFNFPQMCIAVGAGGIPFAVMLQWSCMEPEWVFYAQSGLCLLAVVLILAWALRLPAIAFNVYDEQDVRASAKVRSVDNV